MATRVDSLPTASPFVRLWLGLGEPPTGVRIRGWVSTAATGGKDDRPEPELWARYGRALTIECSQAGFSPAYLTPITQQSPQAQAAARTWEARVRAEGYY